MDSSKELDENSIFFLYDTKNRTIRISLNSIRKVSKRLKVYGMNYGDFETLFEKQDGLCGICHSELNFNAGRGYAIDHDHKTQQVRGLLCHRCNILLANVYVSHKKNKAVNIRFHENRQLYQTPGELQKLKKSILAYLNTATSMPESEKRYVKFDAEKIKDMIHQKYLEKANAGWCYRVLTILKNGEYRAKKVLVPPHLLPLIDRYLDWLLYLELTDPRIVELIRKQREMVKYKNDLFYKTHPERINRTLEFLRIPNGLSQYEQSILNIDFSDMPNLLELLKTNIEGILTDPEEHRNHAIKKYMNINSRIEEEVETMISRDFHSNQ